MNTSLSAQDRKILQLLSYNGRMSDSKIAKKIGSSRETVRYRIKRMINLGIIISFIVVCKVETLGYSTYHLLISMSKCDKKTEEEFIQTLKANKQVNYISTIIGEYDMLIECYAKNIIELNDFIRSINKEYKDHINKIHINTVIEEQAHPHNYLTGKKITEPSIKLKRYPEPKPDKIDELDTKILGLLSINARITSAEIARKLKVSIDKIIYRIRQMEKKEIIQGYKAIIDNKKIGVQRNILLYKIQATEQQENALIEEFNNKNNTLYIMKSLGEWNLTIDICFKNITELRETIQEIRSKHGAIIKEDTTLIQFEEHKNKYFPS